MRTKYINLLSLIFGICAFSLFFTPQSYAVGDLAYRIFEIGILLVSTSITLLYLICYKFDKQWIFFSFFYVFFYFASSILSQSDGSIYAYIFGAAKGIGFITLVKFLLNYNKRIMLLSFCCAGCIMCFFHFISIFKYFNVIGGMRHGYIPYAYGSTLPTTQNWYFLTYDNESIFYFLPLICALIIYGLVYSKYALYVAVIYAALVGFSYIAKGAATASVAFLCFVILAALFLLLYKHRSVAISCNLASIIGIIVSVTLILGIGSGLFSRIAILLGKDPTFTGRSYIWNNSNKYICESPFWGNGIEQTTTIIAKLNQNHCHNIILQILYTGGIFAFAFFVLGIFSTPDKNKNAFSSIVSAAVLAFFIAASLDWYPSIPVPFILFYLFPYCSSSK